MKCVGAADPPCERCIKAGRKCEFLQPGQTLPAQPRRRPKSQSDQAPRGRDAHAGDHSHGAALNRHRLDSHLNHGSASSSYNTPSWTPITPEPSTHGPAKKASELPSVYSASPLATVAGGSNSIAPSSNVVDNQQPPSKRRRTGGHASEPGDGTQEDISERDMEQLLEL